MGRSRRSSSLTCAALSVLLPAGCGPEVLEHAELDELCGQPAPVRLLELPDEPLTYSSQVSHVDGRRILRVSFAGDTEERFGPPVGRMELWSVGECGESPRLMADEFDSMELYPEVWPDMSFGCNHDVGDVTTLDPEGTRPPNVVFRLSDCRGLETPHGIVTVEPHDEDLGALVLQPWPDDPWTQTAVPQVLLDPVRIRAVPSHTGPEFYEVVAVLDDELFAITPDDELVSLSLLDGTLVVEATGVREFEASRDGRFLVWQDVEVTNDDEEWPAGAVFLRDRISDTNTYLVDTMLAATQPSAFTFIESSILRLRLGYINRDPERYWLLPSMTAVDLPAPLSAGYRLDDGRLLVSSYFTGPYSLFDMATEQVRTLFDHDGTASVHPDGSGIDVLQWVECCINQDFGVTEGPLWSIPWDGPRELLAHRVTQGYVELSEGRLLTTVDVSAERVGSMIVIDPETLDEQLVDDHVLTGFNDVENEDEVIYGVTDGERSGVWLTKLAQPH